MQGTERTDTKSEDCMSHVYPASEAYGHKERSWGCVKEIFAVCVGLVGLKRLNDMH